MDTILFLMIHFSKQKLLVDYLLHSVILRCSKTHKLSITNLDSRLVKILGYFGSNSGMVEAFNILSLSCLNQEQKRSHKRVISCGNATDTQHIFKMKIQFLKH